MNPKMLLHRQAANVVYIARAFISLQPKFKGKQRG
uniref:Uncharacterized protein n=1 Tax=Arundo donax TaxID=35708 RepID=A0A0A9C4B7_ARUDO